MSIYAAIKDKSFDDIRTALGSLVRNFEADAVASRQQIRNLLDNEREHFYASSVSILRTSGDSRGAQYLVALLVSNGMLLQALCDPDLSREEALSLGRAARRVDSLIDISLARSLADSAVRHSAVHVADPARLMDIFVRDCRCRTHHALADAHDAASQSLSPLQSGQDDRPGHPQCQMGDGNAL